MLNGHLYRISLTGVSCPEIIFYCLFSKEKIFELNESYPSIEALLAHVFRPDARLYLTDVRFLKEHHAEAALPYSTAYAQWQTAGEQLLMKI